MASANPYHHGNLRAALLEEASRVLEGSGPEAVSLRALARALGVSHAAPGHHFASRAGLLAELAADGFAALADALEAVMATTPSEAWPTEAGRAYIRCALAHPQRYRLMFTSQVMGGDCPPRLYGESRRAFGDLLRSSWGEDRAADPETFQMSEPELAAWSLVHGSVMLWLDGQLPGVPSEERFVELISGVLERSPLGLIR